MYSNHMRLFVAQDANIYIIRFHLSSTYQLESFMEVACV